MNTFKALLLTSVLSVSTLTRASHGACHADFEKFCKDVKAGGGAIVKCMNEHEKDLSAECRAQHETMKNARQEVRKECEDDVSLLCGDLRPGGGAIMKCVHENHDKLSESCKKAIEEKKEIKNSLKKKLKI